MARITNSGVLRMAVLGNAVSDYEVAYKIEVTNPVKELRDGIMLVKAENEDAAKVRFRRLFASRYYMDRPLSYCVLKLVVRKI